jgi:hypothetical protein
MERTHLQNVCQAIYDALLASPPLGVDSDASLGDFLLHLHHHGVMINFERTSTTWHLWYSPSFELTMPFCFYCIVLSQVIRHDQKVRIPTTFRVANLSLCDADCNHHDVCTEDDDQVDSFYATLVHVMVYYIYWLQLHRRKYMHMHVIDELIDRVARSFASLRILRDTVQTYFAHLKEERRDGSTSQGDDNVDPSQLEEAIARSIRVQCRMQLDRFIAYNEGCLNLISKYTSSHMETMWVQSLHHSIHDPLTLGRALSIALS